MYVLLLIENVSKHFGSHQALNQVSVTVPKGRCFGLVGPNGAGKSTLIKIIASIIHDYQGTILFNNQPIKQQKNKIGYVPQDICLEQTVSALQNLYFFGKVYGLRGKQLQLRAESILSYIGLSKRGNDKVLTFSGGMKRRLNIGCALMHDPTLLMMDEPTVGIDPQSREYIFDMIDDLKKSGCTVLYASHYIEEIEKLCDEVMFIDQGMTIACGNVDTLLQEYATPAIYVKCDNCLPKTIDKFGQLSSHNGGYMITTESPLEVMAKILHDCRNNKRSLERLELVQPRLEDVFFSLTGQQLRD